MKLTPQQRNAMHLYFERLADALNSSGYETKAVLAVKTVDVPWNKNTIKELIWRPVQEVMVGKHSTEDLERVEPSDIYEVVNRHIASNFGVSVPWPNREEV